MYSVLILISAVQVLAGSDSSNSNSNSSSNYVCGTGGNFSLVSDWTRISSKLLPHLDNPLWYQGILDTYKEVLDWVGQEGDYWGQEVECVHQLIVQDIDQELLDQAEPFAAILTKDMLDWSGLVETDHLGVLYAVLLLETQEIHKKLRNILGNIQPSLNTNPERGALVSLDTVMVSLMSLLGMMGKLVESGDKELICEGTEMATRDLSELSDLVSFDIQGSSFSSWSDGIALCSVDLPETYEMCQPPLPWPYYWVQDNYLDTQVFFGQQEEAEQFMSEYRVSVGMSVDSLVEVVEMDINTLESVKNMLQMLLPVYC